MQNNIILLFLTLVLSTIFTKNLTACIYSHTTPVVNFLKNITLSENVSNLPLIDCIYVLNLDQRPEKWKRMEEIFTEKGLKVNRVSAINGWNISLEDQKKMAGSYPLRLRGGQIGCLLTHLSIIKDAYERGFDRIWVLEDDVAFIEDPYQLSHLLIKLSKTDPNWDIFYTDVDSKTDKGEYAPSLSSDFRSDRKHLPLFYHLSRLIIDEDIMRIGQRFGMYSFIVSRKGIEKILHYFTHTYLWTAIDIDIHYIPNIREYSTTKEIVSIYSRSISDTETDVKPSLE